MTERDPLRCTYEDARREQLRQGMALSVSAKVAFFEEMVTLAVKFGATDRLADRRVAEEGARDDFRGRVAKGAASDPVG